MTDGIQLTGKELANFQNMLKQHFSSTFPEAQDVGSFMNIFLLGGRHTTKLYKVFSKQFSKFVMVKVVSTRNRLAKGECLYCEKAKGGKLESPNLVKIYDYVPLAGEDSFVVSEFYEGGTLGALKCSTAEKVKIITRNVIPLLLAIELFQSHCIIHRDLKPGNIMLTKSGRMVIIDFGIAELCDEYGIIPHKEGSYSGTEPFIAPELWAAEGLDIVGAKFSDLWGLGVTLYVVITGEHPFRVLSNRGDYFTKIIGVFAGNNLLNKKENHEPFRRGIRERLLKAGAGPLISQLIVRLLEPVRQMALHVGEILVDIRKMKPEAEEEYDLMTEDLTSGSLVSLPGPLAVEKMGGETVKRFGILGILGRHFGTYFPEILKPIGDPLDISLVGSGQFAKVYRVFSSRLSEFVAIRMVTNGQMAMGEIAYYEMSMGGKLESPNLLKVHKFVNSSDGKCLVMSKFYGGETLESLNSSTISSKERVEIVTGMVLRLLQALKMLHSHGIVHGDIKPKNILYDKGQPIIVDFGFARLCDAKGFFQSQEKVIYGTPLFMAPELPSSGQDGVRSTLVDLWALGVVLYMLITDKHPFEGLQQLGNFSNIPDAISSLEENGDYWESFRSDLSECLLAAGAGTLVTWLIQQLLEPERLKTMDASEILAGIEKLRVGNESEYEIMTKSNRSVPEELSRKREKSEVIDQANTTFDQGFPKGSETPGKNSPPK
ncbi:MAG: protein kinase [Rickettsiales bacterium]|jgi:serine/threonine protein kinase|nr:protein kinase [Rickettsiales bacterium]